MIRKFYEADAADIAASNEPVETPSQSQESVSIAALMAKEGVKSIGEDMDANPIRLNTDGSWESRSRKADAPVAPTKAEAKSEQSQESSRSSESIREVPQPQEEEELTSQTEWQELIKNQQPDEVLRALGFDEKAVSFIKELKEIGRAHV